ncbi:MAG: DUF4157 domain-containing protein [Bacteroidota bacterium]
MGRKKISHRSRSSNRRRKAVFQNEKQDAFFQSTDSAKAFQGPATIQAKLQIGQPGDAYEQEADAKANQVMQMEKAGDMAAPGQVPNVQAKCAACEAKEKMGMPKLQKMAAGPSSGVASPSLSNSLQQSKGGGQALPKKTLAFMSNAFGRDFSGVKIHTDGRAVQMNQSLQARAFTNGQDIYFNQGNYNPHSSEGKRLLAHELTHVVQQSTAQEASIQRECDNGKWKYEYDGCSAPKEIAWLFDKDNPAGGEDTHFARPDKKGACDIHDECYQTCAPNEAARKKCDDAMAKKMLLTCDSSKGSWWTKNRCKDWAVKYYTALRLGGKSAFWERQGQVCKCGKK